MSQDAIERRATALQSATARVDDPGEQAMLDRVRTLLSHPAAWTPTPDLALPPLTPEPTPEPTGVDPAPAPRPARRPWRARWTGRWALTLGGAVAAAAAALVLFISLVVAPGPDRESTRFDLTGTPLADQAQASVTATRLEAGWRLTLTIEDLAPADPGVYYQGWVVRDGSTYVPLGTFHMRQPGEVELWAGVDVREFDRFEITRQQVGAGQEPAAVMLAGPIPAQ